MVAAVSVVIVAAVVLADGADAGLLTDRVRDRGARCATVLGTVVPEQQQRGGEQHAHAPVRLLRCASPEEHAHMIGTLRRGVKHSAVAVSGLRQTDSLLWREMLDIASIELANRLV